MPKKAQTTIESEYVFSEAQDFDNKIDQFFDFIFEKTLEINREELEKPSIGVPILSSLHYSSN
jgi:hypothetical protein